MAYGPLLYTVKVIGRKNIDIIVIIITFSF